MNQRLKGVNVREKPDSRNKPKGEKIQRQAQLGKGGNHGGESGTPEPNPPMADGRTFHPERGEENYEIRGRIRIIPALGIKAMP
jgi:hypothetical protein